jgi:hypothetical protein
MQVKRSYANSDVNRFISHFFYDILNRGVMADGRWLMAGGRWPMLEESTVDTANTDKKGG